MVGSTWCARVSQLLARRNVAIREISTGNSAITSSLYFRDGKRVQPSTTDNSQDFNNIEPATGKDITFDFTITCGHLRTGVVSRRIDLYYLRAK